MERAASRCTDWLIENLDSHPVKIFCGRGNNGGDGLAIARQLFERGTTPEVYILEFDTTGSADFETNLSRLELLPPQITFLNNKDSFPLIQPGDVVIDCLFGTGLNRPLQALPAALVEHINTQGAFIVSVDLPAGMFADTTSIADPIIKAKHTLTFQALKLCFLLPENEAYFGEVHVLDIGLHSGFLKDIVTEYEVTGVDTVKQLCKPRRKFSHKGTYGHALIVAGEKGKMGAAILCARGCLRSGAGLVSCVVPSDEFSIIQTAVPEAMAMSREDVASVNLDAYASVAIGPGMGNSDASLLLLNQILSAYTKPMVIDADALNVISQHEGLLRSLPKDSILTPHPKEFERLFGKTVDNFERIKLVKQHAEHLQLYIIVKGFYSMLACPGGEVYFNSTGNPGMATGGSGDVLTGIIAGMLAQGYSSKDACILGMYLHGLAGDLAAQSLSQEALIAGDLIDHLGKAFLLITSA